MSAKEEYSVPDQITEKFVAVLENKNFHLAHQMYSPELFGNLLIEFCSSTVCCRLIRDRGQWLIDIKGNSSVKWFDLGLIRSLILGIKYNPLWAIDDQLQYLAVHLSEVEALFSEQTVLFTEEQLRKMLSALSIFPDEL